MSEPKFKRGDLVRHRASGELAVVISSLSRCTKHTGTAEHLAYHQHGFGPGCELEFIGAYDLDLGIEKDSIGGIPEYLLERVERVRQLNQAGELSEIVVPADEPVMPLRREAERE